MQDAGVSPLRRLAPPSVEMAVPGLGFKAEQVQQQNATADTL
jgi:hypothetical protein